MFSMIFLSIFLVRVMFPIDMRELSTFIMCQTLVSIYFLFLN
jgi:hypothetical protein